MLQSLTAETGEPAVPITPIRKGDLDAWMAHQPDHLDRWVRSTGFNADGGEARLLPGPDGGLGRVLLGMSEADEQMWDWAQLPDSLPSGAYRIDGDLDGAALERAALGWALGAYRFERYRAPGRAPAVLVWPAGGDREAVERAALATYLVRDLINTPASDMGPEELAAAAADLATRHGATCRVIVGDALLEENYPAIHAVGRASPRAPRLIDLAWGDVLAPRVTLVGKGVCFDSGGLDLKTAAGMKLMKKDMGGAANVLGLAHMVMAAGLPVRLRVLVPAVENSVSGDAMRPLDVVRTRRGLTVEIGNTDAEGRVVLADALAEAATDEPRLLIDCATLTGAARVALGTGLPALFCSDDGVANALLAHGRAAADPLWRMPLWKPYRKDIESKVADLTNAPEGAFGGAITAALFLAEFVDTAVPWIHIDMMAWNGKSRPGRPEGGEAMGMRALFALIADRFGA